MVQCTGLDQQLAQLHIYVSPPLSHSDIPTYVLLSANISNHGESICQVEAPQGSHLKGENILKV